MGVLDYLDELGVSVDLLSETLALEEHEILFLTGPPGGFAEVDPGLEMVLLTDPRGFERRTTTFSPERRARGRRRRVGVIDVHAAGLDVHVEVQLRSTYEELLGALERLDPRAEAEPSPAGGALAGLPRETAVELLRELGAARAVTGGAALDELRARLDLPKLAAWNVHHALLRSREAITSAEQSLRSSDAENAYLKLSAAYDALGDAVLAARGEDAERWRQRLPRLCALGPSPFLDRYLDVMLVRRGPSEPLGAFVARQIDEAQTVFRSLKSDAGAPISCG